MAGRLRPKRNEIFGDDMIVADLHVVMDGEQRRIVNTHAITTDVRYVQDKVTKVTIDAAHPDELMPRKGDIVRFRYTPNDLEVMDVRDTHEGLIAVVHQYSEDGLPKGGFACHTRDLRIVKRLTTD